jgi:hypothetical protein
VDETSANQVRTPKQRDTSALYCHCPSFTLYHLFVPGFASYPAVEIDYVGRLVCELTLQRAEEQAEEWAPEEGCFASVVGANLTFNGRLHGATRGPPR